MSMVLSTLNFYLKSTEIFHLQMAHFLIIAAPLNTPSILTDSNHLYVSSNNFRISLMLTIILIGFPIFFIVSLLISKVDKNFRKKKNYFINYIH
jgi:hypothetical protein